MAYVPDLIAERLVAGQYCWALVGLAGVSQVYHMLAPVVLPLWSCSHSPSLVVLPLWSCSHSPSLVVLTLWSCTCGPVPMALPLWSCSHSPSLMTWMWQQRRLTLASPPLSVARAGCECGEDAPSGCAGLCVHLNLSLGSVCQSRGLPTPWALPWE